MHRWSTLLVGIAVSSAGCGSTGSGLSQSEFTERYTAAWCPLAVDCPREYRPDQFDLSSVEACVEDVSEFMLGIGGGNCNYDADEGEAVLAAVEVADCAAYQNDVNMLMFSSAFPCENLVD